MGLSNQRYWGKNITKNPSCQFLNFTSPTLVAMDPWAMKQPPAKNPTNIPVAWWWCSWFLIVTSDTAQTAEEAVTLKVLAGFFFWQLHIWQIEIWIFKVMEGAGRQYYIFRFQFTQLQDICIVSVYIPGTLFWPFCLKVNPSKTRPKIQSKQPGHLGSRYLIYSEPPEVFLVGNTNGEVTYPTAERNATGSCERKCVCISVSTTPGIIEPAKKGQNHASWWFQPIWNILVKLDHLPR